MNAMTKIGKLVALAGAATLLFAAAPAWAHEEINPPSFTVGKPVFFTLNAANEETADLTKVTLTAPKALPFGATTKEPTGWSVDRTDQVITWTGGAVKPDRFDQWGFEIESADQPGTFTYRITLSFADGKTDDVSVPVTALAAGATTNSPTKTASAVSLSSVHSARSRANLALVVGIVAVAVAGLASVLALARRRAAGSPPSTGTSQDW